MSLTNTFETSTLEWLLTTNSVTRPTVWYVAAMTTASTDSTPGTEVTTTGTAYARQAVTFTVTGNTATNSAAIEFPTATASYGTVTDISVFDASTGGNEIAYGTVDTSRTIDTGDILRLEAGALDITMD